MPEYTPYPGESQSAFQRRMLGRLAGGERLGMLGMARGTRGGLLPGVGGYQPPTGSGSAIASLMGEGPSSDIARVGGNFISRSGASQAAPAPPVPTGMAMPGPRLNPSNTGIAMPQLGARPTGDYFPGMDAADYFPGTRPQPSTPLGPASGAGPAIPSAPGRLPRPDSATVMRVNDNRIGLPAQYSNRLSQPGIAAPEVIADIQPLEEGSPDDPQSFMSKVGGFFTRPTTSQALMSAGAAMMSGRDAQGNVYGNALESVGAGLQAGIGAYGQAVETQNKIKADEITAANLLEDRTLTRENREAAIAAINSFAESSGATEAEIAQALALNAGGELSVAFEGLEEAPRRRKVRDQVTSFIDGLTPEQLDNPRYRLALDVAGNDSTDPDEAMTTILAYQREESGVADRLATLTNAITVGGQIALTPEMEALADELSGSELSTNRFLENRGNWDRVEDGNYTIITRDGQPVSRFLTADPNSGVDTDEVAALATFVEEQESTGDRKLWNMRKGLQAASELDENQFGTGAGLVRKAYQALLVGGVDEAQQRDARAGLQAAMTESGFANLSQFVGPTSDYEFGIAQILNGDPDMSKADFMNRMQEIYRMELDKVSRHNNNVLRSLPEDMQDQYLIQFAEDDIFEDTWGYLAGQEGSSYGSPGQSRMLGGQETRSRTGALQDKDPGPASNKYHPDNL